MLTGLWRSFGDKNLEDQKEIGHIFLLCCLFIGEWQDIVLSEGSLVWGREFVQYFWQLTKLLADVETLQWRGERGLIFIRPFNDLEVEEVKNHLQPIQGKRVLLCQEDMMFLKEARDGRFSVKLLDQVLEGL